MSKFFNPVNEAMMYLTCAVCGASVSDTLDMHIADNPDCKNEILSAGNPALVLEKFLNENVKIDFARYEFYFAMDFSENDSFQMLSNTAFLLMGSVKNEDDLQTAIARRKQFTIEQKLVLFKNTLSLNNSFCSRSTFDVSCGSAEKFLSYVEESNLSWRMKRKTIELFENFNYYIDELASLLEPVVRLIESRSDEYGGFIRYEEELLEENPDIVEYLKRRYRISLPQLGSYSIHLSLLASARLNLSVIDGQHGDIFLGVCMLDVIEAIFQYKNPKKIAPMLKTISDEVRLDILRCISVSPMYGVELAEKLGLSNPTISYHITKLIQAGFVNCNLENGKSYYSLAWDNIEKFIEMLKDYLKPPRK